MQLTYTDPDITIIDNFLDEETLALVREQSECLKMQKIELGDDKAYKMNSGDIYKSENKYWSDQRPWNNNFEPFMNKLVEWVSNNKSCLPEKQWEKISCMLHVYMVGAELSWHWDGKLGGGSYSYYIHDDWRHTWGGNLLIASPDTKFSANEPSEGTSAEDMIGRNYNRMSRTWNLKEESDMILNPGYGRYFAPLPNRLMLTTGTTMHKVERIDTAAGENTRRSLTGFLA